MNNITIGIIAHVDSGKTTLSEAILYTAGAIKEYGRVDNRDSFLDNNSLERQRGITIFSKQANFMVDDTYISMIDTPGHVDFSAETERTLQVLDYAILVVNGSEEIKGHTLTLWRLLKVYNVPTFIFVNKMDMAATPKETILSDLKKELGISLIDFTYNTIAQDDYEHIALLASETEYSYIFDDYLNSGIISVENINLLIKKRIIFPVYCGSALKLTGIRELIEGISMFTFQEEGSHETGGIVFKITKDEKGNRLAHIKVTDGCLNVKTNISPDNKINQLRIYSGEKYELKDSVEAGKICTATGLGTIKAGTGFGCRQGKNIPLIEPVLTYNLLVPDSVNKRVIYPDIKSLEEEFPELCVEWKESSEDINIKLMGEVQIEILQEIIKERYGFTPLFGTGSITYKETVAGKTIGVGHFEPLKHYAEVHLSVEPAERGSGITISSDCSEDILGKNWQNLILTHIKERIHPGVLTGSELTDVHISLIAGASHTKHTEGGDFRQATYRAVRNALMYAENVLLEPYYDFILTIPRDMVGRAMTDIENMSGIMSYPEISNSKAIIKGRAPVETMRNYQINLNAYTHGTGTLNCTFSGYDICHNQEEIVKKINYNPDEDTANPASSVFCFHGSGAVIPWYQVKEYMHIRDYLKQIRDIDDLSDMPLQKEAFSYSIDMEEIDSILTKTYQANQKEKKHPYRKQKPSQYTYTNNFKSVSTPKDKLLIVDGYNVIFAWEELNSLAKLNINSAKDRLIQILSNYSSLIDGKVILVFDGYKVKDNKGEERVMEQILVIHTKEGVTADQYIETYTHQNKSKYQITVATSDGLIQQIVRGEGGYVLSSRELLERVSDEFDTLRENYNL